MITVIRVLAVLFVFFCAVSQAEEGKCDRLVSLAPSLTQILVELGLKSNLVGVTRYDISPAEVASLPRVGGLLDPNYEAIFALSPSQVLLLHEHGPIAEQLARLGIESFALDHRTIKGIIESVTKIGELCSSQSQAQSVVSRLELAVTAAETRASKFPKVKALVVIGGSTEEGLKNLFISGRDGFYNDLLRIAGGENMYQQSTASFGSISAEGLLALDPEVIIHIRPNYDGLTATPDDALRIWSELSSLRAVKNKRVYVLSDVEVTIPGITFPGVLGKFEDILHPKI